MKNSGLHRRDEYGLALIYFCLPVLGVLEIKKKNFIPLKDILTHFVK